MSTINTLLCIIIVLLLGYCFLLRHRLRRQEAADNRHQAMTLKVSSNDIMQYIRDATAPFRFSMETRQIDFTVKCSPESMMGWMDTDKMDKALLLLLSDMMKNSSPGGKISIDAYTNSSYDKVTIRISDNGKKLSDIVLVMTNQLTHLHHGTVIYEYYEGQGNTVLMVLPIRKDAYPEEQMSHIQSSLFNIPQNIELNVPTMILPANGENARQNLGAIIQQAYSSTDQQYLQRAVKCVNDHLMDSGYDREAFAADMGSSVSTLYNKIRALTGKNVTTFIRDIRIKNACRLVKENPELRVSDIAYQVGFKDPKYFATTFKRVMGIQPKEYMKGLQSLNN